MRDFL